MAKKFVNFAAFSGVFWGLPLGISVVQPTAKHTKRTAIIALANNDNRPLISTLRDLVNSDFQNYPPPILFMENCLFSMFLVVFCFTCTLQSYVFSLISPNF